MLHLTRDAALLRTRQQLEAEGWQRTGEVFRQGQALYVPVYEEAMLQPWGASHNPGQLVSPRYWAPSERVMQAVAHVPEALLQAYRTRRADAVVKMLSAWVGGYHLNHGHNTCTRETLAQVYNPMFHALPSTPGAWVAAPALEREWPLTPSDLLLIKRQHDALTLARHLIEKHCPDWFMAWREVVAAGAYGHGERVSTCGTGSELYSAATGRRGCNTRQLSPGEPQQHGRRFLRAPENVRPPSHASDT